MIITKNITNGENADGIMLSEKKQNVNMCPEKNSIKIIYGHE